MLNNFSKYCSEKVEYKNKNEHKKYLLTRKGKQNFWTMKFRNNLNKEICSGEFNSIQDFEENFQDIENIINVINSIQIFKKNNCIIKLTYSNVFYITISFDRSFWYQNTHCSIYEEYNNIPIDLTNLNSFKSFLSQLLSSSGFSPNKEYIILNVSKNFVDILDINNSFIELTKNNLIKAKKIKGYEIPNMIQLYLESLSFIPEDEMNKFYQVSRKTPLFMSEI